MKTKFVLAIPGLLFCFIAPGMAVASLEVTDVGTSAFGTHKLIYDRDLDVTWYDFSQTFNPASSDGWQQAVDWATNLSVSVNGETYDSWRLPHTVDGVLVQGFDGSTTGGYNVATSEMGHLFYTELGNLSELLDWGRPRPGYIELANTGPFDNLLAQHYWSGTLYAASAHAAWDFDFSDGRQVYYTTSFSNAAALAVIDGHIGAAVPIPAAIGLFATGLIGLAGAGTARGRIAAR